MFHQKSSLNKSTIFQEQKFVFSTIEINLKICFTITQVHHAKLAFPPTISPTLTDRSSMKTSCPVCVRCRLSCLELRHEVGPGKLCLGPVRFQPGCNHTAGVALSSSRHSLVRDLTFEALTFVLKQLDLCFAGVR